MLLLVAGSALPGGPLLLTQKLLSARYASLLLLFRVYGIGSRLSPFRFQDTNPRQVIYYELFN